MINVLWRIFVSFSILWVGLRLLGRKQLGELTPYNVALMIAVGQIASDLATDVQTSALIYIVALIAYFLLTFLMSFISLNWPPARKVLEGSPLVVVANGRILEANLKKLHMSIDNLTGKLREQQIFNLQQVEFVVVEPDGKVSVLLKPPYQPVTADTMKLVSTYQGLPVSLIKDGRIVEKNLNNLNLTKDWLVKQLQARNIPNASAVFLAQLDGSGQLYCDLYTDWEGNAQAGTPTTTLH